MKCPRTNCRFLDAQIVVLAVVSVALGLAAAIGMVGGYVLRGVAQ